MSLLDRLIMAIDEPEDIVILLFIALFVLIGVIFFLKGIIDLIIISRSDEIEGTVINVEVKHYKKYKEFRTIEYNAPVGTKTIRVEGRDIANVGDRVKLFVDRKGKVRYRFYVIKELAGSIIWLGVCAYMTVKLMAR